MPAVPVGCLMILASKVWFFHVIAFDSQVMISLLFVYDPFWAAGPKGHLTIAKKKTGQLILLIFAELKT